MEAIPSLLVPASRSDMNIVWGGGTQIAVRRPDEIQPISMPDKTQNMELIIAQTMREVLSYFGLDPENPQKNQGYLQDLVDDWLGEIKQVLEQVWALIQQFQPDEEVNIVTGGTLQTFDFEREQIQGKYDLSIQFDAKDLDTDLLREKMAFWTEMMAADSEAAINRTEFIKMMASAVDPIGAEALISSPQQISARELEDEQGELAKIGGGIEPPLNPEGKNAGMRLQIIKEAIQNNPNNVQRYQEDEVYRAMIDARMDMFKQTLAQQKNAQIGRVGAAPALDQLQQ